MTSDELLKRCIKVIQSCVSEKQLNNAIHYCNLANNQKLMECDINSRIRIFIVMERAIAVTQYKISEGIT